MEGCEGVILDTQREKNMAWVILLEVSVGISGRVGREGRPGLDAALNQARNARCPLAVYAYPGSPAIPARPCGL